MAEPRSFLDVIRSLNIGPTGLSPSAYSRVGSSEEARQAQTALENRPAPTPVTLPTVPNIGIRSLQAARMAEAEDPAVRNMAASLAPAAPFTVPAALTPAESVSAKTTAAINVGGNNGTNMGNANRKAAAAQTLMGGDMGSFVSNLLRMFAQPEFQQAGFAGQGFGPTVLGATRALRAMETQDAEMEKARLEALANVKAAGPSFDLSSQSIELVDRITGANQALEAIQNLKKVLSAARVSGGGPAALQALKNFGNFFGVQLEASKPEEYKIEINKLKQAILSSGLFGREATKAEYKILEDIVAAPGLFTGDPVLLAKLRGLEKSFNAKIVPAERMLRAAGVPTDNLFAPNLLLWLLKTKGIKWLLGHYTTVLKLSYRTI